MSVFGYFKACDIILRDQSCFQKRILNLPGCLRAENLIEYVFCATLLVSGIDFFVPPPLRWMTWSPDFIE
jgi:hypothetical protein